MVTGTLYILVLFFSREKLGCALFVVYQISFVLEFIVLASTKHEVMCFCISYTNLQLVFLNLDFVPAEVA